MGKSDRKYSIVAKTIAMILLSVLTVVDAMCAGILSIIAAPTMTKYFTGYPAEAVEAVMTRFYYEMDTFIA